MRQHGTRSKAAALVARSMQQRPAPHGLWLPFLLLLVLLGLSLSPLASVDPIPPAEAQQPDLTQEHIFHTWAMLTADLTSWNDDYPERVQLLSAGQTIQGRDQWVLHITDFSVDDPKQTVYIDGGHHGNEYLGTQLAFLVGRYYAYDYLDDDAEARARAEEVLRTTDIWILVMLNADGNDRDTRWNVNNVDLNRNYDFMFDAEEEQWAGPSAFSEPETTNNARMMAEYASDADLYVTMHTGVWQMLYPWGFTGDLPPDDDLYSLVRRHVNANVSGAEDLEVTPANSGLYASHGTSRDYGYGVHGFPVFTFETDEEQWVPGTVERLEDRLGVELDIMHWLIENVWMWRARLEVTALEIEPGDELTMRVANHGAASTDNATLQYRCRGAQDASWTSANFSVSQGNVSTVSWDDVPDGLTDPDCFELHYQKRRVAASTWVTERVDMGAIDVVDEDGEALPGVGAPLAAAMMLLAALAAAGRRRE